jgi:phospholipid transport system substrate-binding protein
MSMNRRSAVCLFASAGAAFALPAWAQDAKADPAAFVADFAQKGIVDILAAKVSQGERTQRFRTMFKEYFDLPSIAKFVLGRYGRNVAPEDEAKFGALFEDVVVYTWARRFAEYNGQTLKVVSSTPDNTDGAIVKSTVVSNSGENIAVDFRLRKRPAGYKAVDVIIAGVSMALTYRQEYGAVLAQGFPALTAQLEKQVADLKKQQPG